MEIFDGILSDSDLPQLKGLALQLTDFLAGDAEDAGLPNDNIGRVVHEILAKAINEGWALIGALRHGAYSASYHHARATIELYAALAYVFADPDETETRAERYVVFPEVYAYNLQTKLQRSFDDGQISEAVFEDQRLLSPDDYEQLEQRLQALADLFGVEEESLNRVRMWHFPDRSITNDLVGTAHERSRNRRGGDVQPIDDPTHLNNFRNLYRRMCKMTHTSPLTINRAGQAIMFGFPEEAPRSIDYGKLNTPIGVTMTMLESIVLLVEEELAVDIPISLPRR